MSAALRAIREVKNRREESIDVPDRDDTAGTSRTFQLSTSREASPDAAAERGECRRAIAAALARLPENRRLAVGLHLRGLTTLEIGAALGWSEPKARNLVHRGLKDLRGALRALGVEVAR